MLNSLDWHELCSISYEGDFTSKQGDGRRRFRTQTLCHSREGRAIRHLNTKVASILADDIERAYDFVERHGGTATPPKTSRRSLVIASQVLRARIPKKSDSR
jgi:hypothetical protein